MLLFIILVHLSSIWGYHNNPRVVCTLILRTLALLAGTLPVYYIIWYNQPITKFSNRKIAIKAKITHRPTSCEGYICHKALSIFPLRWPSCIRSGIWTFYKADDNKIPFSPEGPFGILILYIYLLKWTILMVLHAPALSSHYNHQQVCKYRYLSISVSCSQRSNIVVLQRTPL